MKTLKGKWIWWGVFVGFCEEDTEHGIYVSHVSRQPYPDDEMFALLEQDSKLTVQNLTRDKHPNYFISWYNLSRVVILSDNQMEKFKV